MTNDYQKTMVEHDYGTAGYLVNHPDTNVAAAFTKDKTDSDLEAGRRILKEAGYHGNADPRLIPAVYAYRRLVRRYVFLCFSSCFSDSLDLHPETKQSDSKGRYCDYPVPFRGYGTED
jgi:predicted Zn-dependent protease